MFGNWLSGGAMPACVYPRSIRKKEDALVFMANWEGEDRLFLSGSDLGFSAKPVSGEDALFSAPLNKAAAAHLRVLFPFTAPVPVLSYPRTIGVGDRLGLAGPGHLRVFETYDALPVLAQQSIRELNLTNRTYQDVLDAATFAVFREGFTKGFGADGDHLKTMEDVAYALSLGFTMITLDCSDHIDNGASALSDAEALAKAEENAALDDLYLGKTFTLGEGGSEVSFSYTKGELARIRLVYGKAVGFAENVYNRFFAGSTSADFELSIDETLTPTTPPQHFFVANELTRRGVKLATVAPRFCGEFQKGVDYQGDIDQFAAELSVHAAIAKHFGYKLSVHSGSDKFSIFPLVGRLTEGNFHLKTAGTNWLEAMALVARKNPALYREVHAFALEKFPEALQYYRVDADLAKIPPLSSLSDKDLPQLFAGNDARQLIHITYGLILSAKEGENFRFRDRLYAFWQAEAKGYADALEAHIGRHLALLGVPQRS